MPLSFGARPWCDVPAAASNAKPAPRGLRRRRACARCLWGGGAALELAARARRAALVVVGSCPSKGTAPARGLSPSARGRGATCQLRPPTPSQRRVSRTAQARRCSLSLGRRRSTRACFARAPCRAGCGRFVSLERGLRRREASLLRRAAVVRRASCDLKLQASAACVAQRRRVGARCLWEGGAALELASRARRAALDVAGFTLSKGAATARCFSPSARDRGATCQLRPPTQASAAWLARRRRGGARCLWGGGAALELAARAPCRAGCGRSVASKGTARREASLLRRAPWCDVPAAASNAKPAPRARAAQARCARCLWEEAQHSSLLRARRAALVVVGLVTTKGHCDRREASLLRRAPWCDVPAAASNAKPAPRVSRRRRAGARCLWGGGAALELAARARRAALVVAGSHLPKGLRRREASLLRRAPVVRRASCGLQRQASAACRAAQARRRSLSLGRRRSTRACLRARRAALVVVGPHCQRKLCRREASLLRRAAVVRRASCGLQRQASAAWLARRRCAALAVSGEEAQHSSLLRARAVPRWLWSVRVSRKRPHRREASLFRRAAVVRRASCDLQRQASAACLAQRRRAGARCLWEEAQHSSLLRVRAVLRSLWPVFALSKALRQREASLFRRAPWCDVPAAASNAKPAPRGSRGAGAAALAVSGEETQHSSLLRARAVPRWLWSVRTLPKGAAPARGLSPSSRAVVRRASCSLQLQASAACSRGAGAPALAVSGEEAQHSSLLRARRAALVCSLLASYQRALRRREASLLRRAPWCDVPAAASNAKPAPRGLRGAGARCARCLWGGDAALELAARARRAALVVVGPRPANGAATGKRPLSFGARPWCDVPAAASNSKPAPLGLRRRRAVLAVSGEEAQHSSLLRVRAVPRWL